MGESKFTGTLLGFIGMQILTAALISFTCGLATPFAVCLWHEWISKHTIIDGRLTVFTGSGLNLLGNCIKWGLLTIVTLGIYSLWIPIKYRQWIAQNTHFEPDCAK